MVANPKVKTLMFAVLPFMFFTTVADAGGLPKVGERVYVIKKDSSKPVVIENVEKVIGGNDVVLKDPSLDRTERPSVKVVKKPVLKTVKPVRKNSQLTFKPATISGNMRNPRVEFQREYLKVGISEESYGQDFFQKVNEPLTNSDF